MLRRIVLPLIVLSGLWPALARAADDPVQSVLVLLHTLDYVGVDYPGTVRDGKVVDTAEYQEQAEFAGSIITQIGQLPERPGRPELMGQARSLQQAIAAKSPGDTVAKRTAALSQAVLRSYPVAVAPRQAPNVGAAATLFEQQCSGCHGLQGRGDGALAASLEPKPIDFHDAARQRERSVFGLYNVVSQGVDGTSMAAFRQLTDEQRWSLAFYVSQLIYTDEQRSRGESLWKAKAPAAGAIGSLQALSEATPASLEGKYGQDGVNMIAYLRANPQVLAVGQSDALGISSAKLSESLAAYGAGKRSHAMQLALTAYLEGFELAEATLAAVDAPLMRQIEGEMMKYRELIKSGAPVEAVAAQEALLQKQLHAARERLESGGMSAASSFVGSFVILAREGLEAILVLAAMVAFLRKTGRAEAMRYVHVGWISALALGVATWFAATYLIDISGASREKTEGYTALLAAAILLSVGLWLHNKSYSNRWQQYVAGKIRGALEGSRLWGIAALAFIAVYREVFETVLFYRALWAQGDQLAIVLGFAVALVTLIGIIWGIFWFSMKLPVRQFFSWSSAFIVVLAVIFTGKGVAALQEAGAIPVHSVNFVAIPMLGVYPSLQVLLMQLVVLAAVLGGFAWNHFTAKDGAPA